MYTEEGVMRRADRLMLALERRNKGGSGSHPPKKTKPYTLPHPMMRSDEASSSLWDREYDDVLYARDYAPLWSRSPMPVNQPAPQSQWSKWPAYSRTPPPNGAKQEAPKHNAGYSSSLQHPQPTRPGAAKWVDQGKRADDAGLWEREDEELWVRMEVDEL
ncbi:hypothetical protein C8Q72DRAFT_822979, partial [Fomitopsis betulina]